MTSIWTLEDGQYSDYHIVGVYSTEAKAEEAKALYNRKDQYANSNEGWIVERTLDELDNLNQGLDAWVVSLLKDGTVEYTNPCDPFEVDAMPNIWDRPGSMHYKKTQDPKFAQKSIRMTVWATDASHAVKIVNERRIIEIAEGRL